MSWLRRLLGWLLNRPPGPVTHIHLKVHMKTITLSWDLPVVREDGKALPKEEVDYTEVFLQSTVGGPFASLAQVEPDATQTINRDLPDGTYVLRLVVTDIYGKKSKPVDATGTIASAPPGVVTNVKLTIS